MLRIFLVRKNQAAEGHFSMIYQKELHVITITLV